MVDYNTVSLFNLGFDVICGLISIGVLFQRINSRADATDAIIAELKIDTSNTLKALESRISTLEGQKSNETRWIVDQHTKQIENLTEQLDKTSSMITEIGTDLRVIAEWVSDQKRREKSS